MIPLSPVVGELIAFTGINFDLRLNFSIYYPQSEKRGWYHGGY
jgi:hypothetical protein